MATAIMRFGLNNLYLSRKLSASIGRPPTGPPPKVEDGQPFGLAGPSGVRPCD
jgi:hypothetical protein